MKVRSKWLYVAELIIVALVVLALIMGVIHVLSWFIDRYIATIIMMPVHWYVTHKLFGLIPNPWAVEKEDS